MLNYALLFLILAMMSGVVGFAGGGGVVTGIAKVAFIVFGILSIIFTLVGAIRSRSSE